METIKKVVNMVHYNKKIISFTKWNINPLILENRPTNWFLQTNYFEELVNTPPFFKITNSRLPFEEVMLVAG